MKNRIAAGFQNTVDFELVWDTSILESLISQHDIQYSELSTAISICSERSLILTLLQHMKSGSGSECIVSSSEITRSFASHFSYSVTLGGTALRAAMAIEKLGYHSSIHACSLNHYFRRLTPPSIHWVSSVPDEGENFHPHVIVQYPEGAHIHVNDIDIITTRPNRVIFAYDPPSMNLEITPHFSKEVSETNVLLVASYNIIEDPKILADRLTRTIEIIKALPQPHIVIMEDACYKNPKIRSQVTQTLAPHLDIFSMNEDELQDRVGRVINLMNVQEVADAIHEVYMQIKVPTLICHCAHWALAYGKLTDAIKNALESGICTASTRFRMYDDYGEADFLHTRQLPPHPEGTVFCKALMKHPQLCPIFCLPGKDLSTIPRPCTIGLGDAFVGGMLPSLLPEENL